MRRAAPLFAAILGLALPPAVPAHPGGLNAEGCHNNRKTGEYHCHRGAASGRRPEAAPRQSFSPTGSGRPAARPFANCAEARAAGAAPIRRGDPGYSPRLDRDNDGVACE